MKKKGIINFSLVDESLEMENEEIEKEIRNELAENLHSIPWAAKIDKVEITES